MFGLSDSLIGFRLAKKEIFFMFMVHPSFYSSWELRALVFLSRFFLFLALSVVSHYRALAYPGILLILFKLGDGSGNGEIESLANARHYL